MTRRCPLLGVALIALLGCRGANAQEVDLEVLIDQCRHDVAEAAQVNDTEVQVTRVEAVVWSDGSLGYPEPGMDYIQMLIPGYRVTLQADGRTYEYHTDEGRRVVWRAEGGKGPAQVIGLVELPGTVVPPESSRPGILYLEPVPDEPNLNCRLRHMGTGGQETVTHLDRCTDFVVTPRGWLLAKERTSRSTHELVLMPTFAQGRVVADAFDFAALTFSQTDSRYAVLVRGTVGQPWVLHLGTPEDEAPEPLEWAPTVQRGDLAHLSLAGDILLLTVPDSDDEAPRNLVLDLQAQKLLAEFRSPAAALAPGP